MFPYTVLVLLCLYSPGFGQVPEPANVTIESVNFRTFLRWSPPPGFGEEEDVIYTVEYKLDVDTRNLAYSHFCVTRELHCDLSLITYKFYARVKAAVSNSQSSWVTVRFDPYYETLIGPPGILASSRSGHIDLSFSGPYIGSSDNTLKDKYGDLVYRVEYWEQSQPDYIMNLSTTQSNEILSDLESWTWYCLRVQAYIPSYSKEGQFSPIICERTTDDGRIPWWQLALIFFVTMVVVILVVLGFSFMACTGYKRYKSLPRYSIPQHLKDFLSTPFSNTPHLPTQPSEECGDSSEQLTFVSVDSEETKEESNESV